MTQDKLEIIIPFLENKKTLKDISKEKKISYTTLKRWVKKYKEKGLEGLKTKERSDKKSFRKANENLILQIKEFYLKNKDKPILPLYKDLEKKIGSSISFNTFYRIIQNLNEYLKTNQNLKVGERYILKTFISYNFININNCRKLPVIFLVFDAFNLELINFHISFSNTLDLNILSFLRTTILIGLNKYNTIKFPKEILIDSNIKVPKKLLKLIYKETSIKFLNTEINNLDIDKFIKFCSLDINKSLDKFSSYDEFYFFLISYLKLNLTHLDFENIETSELLNQAVKLNVFLPTIKRKIHPYGIRVHNYFYNNKKLIKYIGEIGDIIYNPLKTENIYLFINKHFIGKVEKSVQTN